jgi:transcriptional regulator with XRE-family HTH domain
VLGDHLRKFRTDRGLSLRELARSTNYSHSYLWEIETGRRPFTDEVALRCDVVLATNGELVRLAGSGGDMPADTVDGAIVERKEAGTERRDVLRGLASASLAVAGWPLGSRVRVDLPARIGQAHVDELREATNLYRAWVARHGAGDVRHKISLLLERASAMYESASDGSVRSRILAGIADLAGLNAYAARDVEAHVEASESYQLALQAARAAGERQLGAHLIVRMAGHNIELHRPADTLGLLDAAQRAAMPLLTAGERANQRCIEAWANAQSGDAEAVHRAVGEAEQQFTDGAEAPAPDWGRQHVTEAELYSLTGAAYVELAKTDQRFVAPATQRLNRAIELRGLGQTRNRSLDLISLAEAQALAGEVDESGRLALSALRQTGDVVSARLSGRLRQLRGRLAPHARKAGAAAEFVASAAANPLQTAARTVGA